MTYQLPVPFDYSTVDIMTDEEWNEMVSLKNEINFNPANVVPEKMERFSELYVRSIAGKGDNTVAIHSYNELP